MGKRIDPDSTLGKLMAYAKANKLPYYCQRGQAVRELAARWDAEGVGPQWVMDAMKAGA